MSKALKIGITWTKTAAALALLCAMFAVSAFAQGTLENEDTTIYDVVLNHEEQYMIWPAHKELPLSWRKAGFKGKKQEEAEPEVVRKP